MEESSIVAQQHPKHDNSGTNHTQNSADSFLLPEGILGYSPLPRNSVQRSPSLQDGTTHSIQPAPTTASPLRYRPGLPSNSNNISYSEIDDIRGEVAARLQEVKQQRSRSAVEEEGARPRRRRSSASPDPFGRPSR
ncbi:hypothetical protein AGDE_16880 [Angomonas deanei]|nr:hypothetical protein AGDE_16956 [Angomonas deanei]EPY15987.1 hypothetical protein AGDE_16880 [Angomonas deanei]|eukprot:EPY15815.1 hypothetical protein AGDE_16956 [Angomonas deanei]